MNTKLKVLSFSIMTALGVSACGGSGSSSNVPTEPPEVKTATITTTVEVTDANGNAIVNGTACVDDDSNGVCDDYEVQGPISNGRAQLSFEYGIIDEEASQGTLNAIKPDGFFGPFLAVSSDGSQKFKYRYDGAIRDLPSKVELNIMTTVVTDCSYRTSCGHDFYENAQEYVAQVLGTTVQKLDDFRNHAAEKAFFVSLEETKKELTPDNIVSGDFNNAVVDIANAIDQGKSQAEIDNFLKKNGKFSGIENEPSNPVNPDDPKDPLVVVPTVLPSSGGVMLTDYPKECGHVAKLKFLKVESNDSTAPKMCWSISSERPQNIDEYYKDPDNFDFPYTEIINSTDYNCATANDFEAKINEAGTLYLTYFVKNATSVGGFGYLPMDIQANDTCKAVNPVEIRNKVIAAKFAGFYTFENHNDYAYSVLWNFGDGTTSSERKVVHQFKENGLHEVQVSITDKKGNVSTKTLEVEVTNADVFPPTVKPILAFNGLKAVYSHTPARTENDGYSVSWDFDEERKPGYWNGFGRDNTYTYNNAGTYTIKMNIWITNGDLYKTITVGTFKVEDIPGNNPAQNIASVVTTSLYGNDKFGNAFQGWAEACFDTNGNEKCDDNEPLHYFNEDGRAEFNFIYDKNEQIAEVEESKQRLNGNFVVKVYPFFEHTSEDQIEALIRRVDTSIADLPSELLVNRATDAASRCSMQADCAKSFEDAVFMIANKIGTTEESFLALKKESAEEKMFRILESAEVKVDAELLKGDALNQAIPEIAGAEEQQMTYSQVVRWFKKHGSFTGILDKLATNRKPSSGELVVNRNEDKVCPGAYTATMENASDPDGDELYYCWKFTAYDPVGKAERANTELHELIIGEDGVSCVPKNTYESEIYSEESMDKYVATFVQDEVSTSEDHALKQYLQEPKAHCVDYADYAEFTGVNLDPDSKQPDFSSTDFKVDTLRFTPKYTDGKSYKWTFSGRGTKSTSTEVSPEITFNTSDPEFCDTWVTLTVVDPEGYTHTSSKVVSFYKECEIPCK